MSNILEQYLDRVMLYANRNTSDTVKIRTELQDHLSTKAAELQAQGMPLEQAVAQAVQMHGDPRTIGYGLRPRFPFLDIRTQGTARGFIAIGPKAIGIIAIGGISLGVFSLGGISFGLTAVGGLAVGLLLAVAGCAISPLGFSFGIVALGLAAGGIFAMGIEGAGGRLSMFYLQPGPFENFSLESNPGVPIFIRMLHNYINSNFFGFFIFLFWFANMFFLATYLVLTRKERFKIEQAEQKIAEA